MQQFSIKDLESFTGIKAHTIRIWEQRYNLLSPQRTSTNIRFYTDHDLRHLLNVGVLIDHGYKISRIAEMTEEEINNVIAKLRTEDTKEQHYLNLLKISMLNYDEALFTDVTNSFLADHSIELLFERLFLPFMQQVGVLWLTSTICPAQEHFISNLLRQKLFRWIDELPDEADSEKPLLVLYLPQGEIHEISLLLMHFYARKRKYRSVFLGQSVPFEDLMQIAAKFPEARFITYCTTNPTPKNAQFYVDRLHREFVNHSVSFYLGGRMFAEAKAPAGGQIQLFVSGTDLVNSAMA